MTKGRKGRTEGAEDDGENRGKTEAQRKNGERRGKTEGAGETWRTQK